MELELSLQNKTWLVSVVVLDSNTLAFPALLGLDFVFYTGLQLETGNYVAFFSAEVPSATALLPTGTTLEDSNLLLKEVQESNLEEHRKPLLYNMLQEKMDVCTTNVGLIF